jgi:hypothetical protein
MGSLSNSPRTIRGAILAVRTTSPLPRIVVFQYNPDTVTRTLRPRATPAEERVAPGDANRLAGAPVETFSMTVEIDATDQLEARNPVAAITGISPHLAALELLMYPPVSDVISRAVLLAGGTVELSPPETPLTILVWGPSRVVPVQLDSLAITEQAFDQALNPTRASVELSAQVLSYNDLQVTDGGYSVFLAHQLLKESVALYASAIEMSAFAARI